MSTRAMTLYRADYGSNKVSITKVVGWNESAKQYRLPSGSGRGYSQVNKSDLGKMLGYHFLRTGYFVTFEEAKYALVKLAVERKEQAKADLDKTTDALTVAESLSQ